MVKILPNKHARKAYDDLIKAYEALINKQDGEHFKLESAIEDYNSYIGDLNESISDLRSFLEGIHGEMENDFSERSDAWRKSDTGQLTEELITSWSDAMEALTEVDGISVPDLPLPKGLDALNDIAPKFTLED